ncbi:DNA ligase 1 isoform X2 [Culex pipiens pallens]|uniref:DNA ligase 1 isoform X2 n=1 Tax=Culex pipiens pallens TaxID=42434 RepID=UPI001952F4EF|nr:DNA ligase 1 isoform X2 [Culex pipiens pallens]
MPVNGSNRPPWLKDRVDLVNKNVPPAWAARKNSLTSTPSTAASDSSTKETKPAAKADSNEVKTAPILKKPAVASATPKENGETTKTAKLQSKEIKVPIVVQQKKPVPPPLTKPEPMIKNTTPKMTVLREPPKPKPKEPSPESESEEEEEEVEEEEEEEEEEEGSTEYETETESEEEEKPAPPPVKKPEPPKREPSPPKPKLPVQLKKVSRSPDKTDTDSKSSKSEKSSSPEPKPFFKPPLKKVIRPPSEPKERSTSPEPKGFRVQLRKVPSNLKAPRVKEKLPEVQLKKVEKPLLEDIPKKEEAYPHKPSALRSESSKRIPPPPPMPKSNIPPPPPPPPKLGPPPDFKKDDVSDKQKEVIEKLKKRPRRRPDWSDMMKEVEQGRKLRHVQCNDRSQPIIHSKSITKVKDQFIFETEKAGVHNVLLKEINAGVKLRTVKCNDRSKPNLEGLRKFRRQMTLEEQLAKSESRANLEAPPPDEEEVDEMDDIDKVRDDLQSTKQLLAMELRNNEALERENKRLAQRVSNLEAELSRERWNPMGGEEKTNITGADAELIKSLKGEAVEAQRQSKQLEEKYQTVAKELDTAYKQTEEQKRKIAELERRLQSISSGGHDSHAPRRSSEAAQKESSPELAADEEEEEEEEEDEEKKAEKAAKRLNREVNMLSARLMRLKEKQEEKHAERQALKYAMKTNQYALKNEQKKYKKLQKEVDKMAAMMKLEDEDEDGEEPKEPPPEEPEEEEEEEEEESEEETESESESGSECESVNEAEDAPDEKKKVNLEPRVKRHEGRLASLKKGNYLLQANVDRIKDEINKIREMCCTLQSDLDSVIADLG